MGIREFALFSAAIVTSKELRQVIAGGRPIRHYAARYGLTEDEIGKIQLAVDEVFIQAEPSLREEPMGEAEMMGHVIRKSLRNLKY